MGALIESCEYVGQEIVSIPELIEYANRFFNGRVKVMHTNSYDIYAAEFVDRQRQIARAMAIQAAQIRAAENKRRERARIAARRAIQN